MKYHKNGIQMQIIDLYVTVSQIQGKTALPKICNELTGKEKYSKK